MPKSTPGAAQIIAAYRKTGDWGATTFERVRYESEATELADGRVGIRFRDLIDHAGHHLDFRCNQILHVGSMSSARRGVDRILGQDARSRRGNLPS